VVLYEIYSKKSFCPNTSDQRLYMYCIQYKILWFHRTRVDFGIMFLKNVVLHEIYCKKSFCPNTFDQRLYIEMACSMGNI
jgi:hypothetical protein